MTHVQEVWDLVFVPLVLLGKGGYAVGDQDHVGLNGVLWAGQRDNHCDFFFPGKANHYQPTTEAKSLTIYAQVQKSGVSSILSLSGEDLSCFSGIPSRWILHIDIHGSPWVLEQRKLGKLKSRMRALQKGIKLNVRWDYLLSEIMKTLGNLVICVFIGEKWGRKKPMIHNSSSCGVPGVCGPLLPKSPFSRDRGAGLRIEGRFREAVVWGVGLMRV